MARMTFADTRGFVHRGCASESTDCPIVCLTSETKAAVSRNRENTPG